MTRWRIGFREWPNGCEVETHTGPTEIVLGWLALTKHLIDNLGSQLPDDFVEQARAARLRLAAYAAERAEAS